MWWTYLNMTGRRSLLYMMSIRSFESSLIVQYGADLGEGQQNTYGLFIMVKLLSIMGTSHLPLIY